MANHIAIIREGSKCSQWRYLETKLNPTDDESRGLDIDTFLHYSKCVRGPDFLWNPEC